MKNKPTIPNRWIQTVLVFLLLLFLILIYFLTPTMTPDQRAIVRFLMALLGGLLTFLIGGNVMLVMRLPLEEPARMIFSATAGTAIFTLLYLVAPYWHQRETAKDVVKDLTGHLSPTSKSVEIPKINLLLLRNGNLATVSEGIIFRSGDKVRISVESPHAGFLYMLQQGSSGQFSVLIPDKRIRDGENRVQGGELFMYPPADGNYEFDSTPGIETVYTFTAKEKTNPLAAAIDRSIASNNRDSRGQVLLDDYAVRVLKEASASIGGKPVMVKVVKLTHQK
jgi:hypothetical protein